MTKKDFKVGQEVCLLYSRFVATDDFVFLTGTVITIGRKYITVEIDKWRTVQFEIENSFQEKTNYSQTYWLFPDKEAALKMLQHRKLLRELRQMPDMWKHLSDRELELANEFLLERNAPLYCASGVTATHVLTSFGSSEVNALLNLKKRYDEVSTEEMDLKTFKKLYQIDIFPVSCSSGNTRKI